MIKTNVLNNREVMKSWHAIKTEQLDSALKTLAAQIAKNNNISEIDKIYVYHIPYYNSYTSAVCLTIHSKTKNEEIYSVRTTYHYIESDSYFFLDDIDNDHPFDVVSAYYDNVRIFIIGDSCFDDSVSKPCYKNI